MAGDETLVVQDLGNGIQLQVAPNRIPLFCDFNFVSFGACKLVYKSLLNSHAGYRETGAAAAKITLFYVFTQGKFDKAIGAFKLKLFG
ncbi:hypothetical protein D3C87_1163340 [compost metagenome]